MSVLCVILEIFVVLDYLFVSAFGCDGQAVISLVDSRIVVVKQAFD